jgi:hypothetical protein
LQLLSLTFNLISMLIKVRVTPHAKKEEFLQKSEDHFVVKVRERGQSVIW